jgi:predicted peptidase
MQREITKSETYRYLVYLPRHYHAGEKWPAILYLHGMGGIVEGATAAWHLAGKEPERCAAQAPVCGRGNPHSVQIQSINRPHGKNH